MTRKRRQAPTPPGNTPPRMRDTGRLRRTLPTGGVLAAPTWHDISTTDVVFTATVTAEQVTDAYRELYAANQAARARMRDDALAPTLVVVKIGDTTYDATGTYDPASGETTWRLTEPMKEAEYLALDADPARMLTHLRTHRRDLVSDRKLRLFACGVMRQVWWRLPWSARSAVAAAEDYADGLVTRETTEFLGRHAHDDCYRAPTDRGAYGVYAAAEDAAQCTLDDMPGAVSVVLRAPCALPRPAMADMIRGVFGNPFSPWFRHCDFAAWNDGAIPRMAEAIYAARSWDELPIFADALEDAGCDDVELLAHCRGPGPHVRGDWVLDLLTGRR